MGTILWRPYYGDLISIIDTTLWRPNFGDLISIIDTTLWRPNFGDLILWKLYYRNLIMETIYIYVSWRPNYGDHIIDHINAASHLLCEI